ncbi:MAG: transcription elongation factor GreA [Epsilonproteobacteria bacterium]|nr:transcription elongation factor GreA [Campylobacterota bacterium]MBD3839463.1 transcription elongation factor GreA [Campylobacterota bacterium]
MQREPMLEKTFLKLTAELEQLKNVERAKIGKVIEEARELGDLKENSEYHSAKEKQGWIETRIIEVTDLLSRAQVINPAVLCHDRVCFGSCVTLIDIDNDARLTYTIVGSVESNPSKSLISINSPVARALMGKKEGDEIDVILPNGQRSFEIESICYIEIEIEE